MVATERIVDCTHEQKLKGAISLLHDEAYQQWLTIEEGTQLERIAWDYFQNAVQNKYVEASYGEACRRQFIGLTQGDRTVVEYEAKFFRLSKYTHGLVASNYNKSIQFEERLKYDIKVLVALQQERVFKTLVEKAKIIEDIKRTEYEKRKKERARVKIIGV